MSGIFVDRTEETRALTVFAERLLRGSGGVLAVEGHAGSGKSALIEEFSRTQAGPRIALARCHGQVGAEDSYGPIVDLLTAAAGRRERLVRWRQRGAPVLRAAPHLLELVPMVGPFLRAGVEAGAEVAQRWGDGGREGALLGQAGRVARALADALAKTAGDHGPLLCVIDDAERIDPSSCLVLDRLTEQLDSIALGFVLVYRSTVWESDGHPLVPLLRRWNGRRRVRTVKLGRLPAPAVAAYARARGAPGTDEQLTEELDALVGGHALLLVQLMDLRQEQAPTAGTLALGDDALDSFDAVVSERLELLPHAAVGLLTAAAVQGTVFSTTVLREVCGLREEQMWELLDEVRRRGDLIEAVHAPTQPSEDGYYRFSHGLLQRLLYRRQNELVRRARHRAVALALERLGGEAEVTGDEALQLAHHHRAGGDPWKAAVYSHQAALSMGCNGSALTEVSVLSARALADLRAVPASSEKDRLILQVLELLLVTSESSWAAAEEAEAGLLALAEEAASTARRTQESVLQARAAFLYGKILLHTRGVNASTEVLRAALEQADSDDQLTDAHPELFLLTAEYGAQLTQRDLAAGVGLMRRADLARRRFAGSGHWDRDPVTALVARQLEKHLGVNALDAGDLGVAYERLTETVRGLRERGVADELHPALNYLAQTLTAMGEYARAEAALHEALDLVRSPGPSAWRAYHRALLGRILLLDGDPQRALHLVRGAVEECGRTGIVSIDPLVRTVLAEVLVVLGADDRHLAAEAERIAVTTAEACQIAGTVRSEVTAWSLAGRARLLLGEPESAREAGQRAVALLERAGGHLPAVVAEEIHYHHSRTLAMLGDTAGAFQLLGAADDEIRRKASSLPQEARAHYLTAVAINRAVASSLTARLPMGESGGTGCSAP
ncbi:AAA family ATPase [Streptomyces sp. NPDC001414]